MSVGNYTRAFRQPNPEFITLYSGFVNNETKEDITREPKPSCQAREHSDVGVYEITFRAGSAKNYTFNYTFGTLTIIKADQEICWEQDLTQLIVGEELELTAVASSELPVKYSSSNNDVVSINEHGGKTYLKCIGAGEVILKALQSGNQNYNSALTLTKTAIVSTNNGNDQIDTPYWTVKDVLNSNMDGSEVTVRGYLVGYVNNVFSSQTVIFSATDCSIASNVVLADERNEFIYTNCIPIQLPAGEVRNTANLKDNPENLGKLVEFDGILASYFGVPGLKSSSAFRIIEEEQDAITEIEEVDNSSPIIYDLSGRRVINPSRPGLYIINGKKVLL